MTNCKFCQTPISEHEAGRCLDAWVTKKLGLDVKGFTTVSYPDGEAHISPKSEIDGWACYADKSPIYLKECVCDLHLKDAEDMYKEHGIKVDNTGDMIFGHFVYCFRVVPHYSTDLNEAIKLWDDDWYITKYGDAWVIKEWSCDLILATAPTPALAIVRAYIKMKEEE